MEIKRQLFHIFFGLILVILLYFQIINTNFLFLLLILGLIISILSSHYKIPVINWFLKNFDRENVFIKGQGPLTFIFGSLLVLLLFEKNIALASILILTFGDSFTHLGYFGKLKNPLNKNKSLEGTIVGILAATLAASIFVSLLQSFLASLIAMTIESLDLFKNKLDDNLILPLIAAFIIYLI